MSGGDLRQRSIHADFRAFVANPRFSCLAAKGVVHADAYRLGVYGSLGSRRSTRALVADMAGWLDTLESTQHRLRAFIGVFPAHIPRTEDEFEQRLWAQLQHLHGEDTRSGSWDPSVSDDPESADFAFSFGGRALFVIGLHPYSSRVARRFTLPALVFNPHAQFERLRADGRFETLRAAVREREIALQGSLNPNLADFGERSEARQYSGRAAESDWRCPFHRAE
ncbi:MAG: guanitoxin biosynthesis heme-dependent pre-guanitoxin N-hydroxylase GntA [Gemmatimonadaceae bacterium]